MNNTTKIKDTFMAEAAAEIERLVEALREIAAIEDEMYGGDWDEIEAARKIATAALEASHRRMAVNELLGCRLENT